jgi:hypothetical protein
MANARATVDIFNIKNNHSPLKGVIMKNQKTCMLKECINDSAHNTNNCELKTICTMCPFAPVSKEERATRLLSYAHRVYSRLTK